MRGLLRLAFLFIGLRPGVDHADEATVIVPYGPAELPGQPADPADDGEEQDKPSEEDQHQQPDDPDDAVSQRGKPFRYMMIAVVHVVVHNCSPYVFVWFSIVYIVSVERGVFYWWSRRVTIPRPEKCALALIPVETFHGPVFESCHIW